MSDCKARCCDFDPVTDIREVFASVLVVRTQPVMTLARL